MMCHIALVHNHEWTLVGLFVVATFPSLDPEKRSLHSFTQNCQLAPHTFHEDSQCRVWLGNIQQAPLVGP